MLAQNRMGRHRTGFDSVCQDDHSTIRNMDGPDRGDCVAAGEAVPYHGTVLSAICCPDKFRGSLTAAEAAAEMAAGLRASGYRRHRAPARRRRRGHARRAARRAARPPFHGRESTGPLGDPVDADWGLLPDGTAVIEMARASGLALVERNDPLRADTRGTGELLLAARAHGATRAIVGARRLGHHRRRARRGRGARLVSCTGSTSSCACDVETRFVDAATVFGPQKGATPKPTSRCSTRAAAQQLDERATGSASSPGAGAAGGLAGGLAALGATLRSGFDVVAEAVGLREQLARRRPRRHRRGQARRVEPRRQGRRRRAAA